MEASRVEFLQQEMGHQVEGVFVGFVEHIPVHRKDEKIKHESKFQRWRSASY